MAEPSELGYRWGQTQGWLSLFLGVAQYVLAPVWISCLLGPLLLCLGYGLLKKRPYGFALVYVVAGLTVLGGVIGMMVKPQPQTLAAVILTVCVWVIPAVMYYPQRYGEFGFREKQK